MTIRTDVTVDWESSPRIITVASPSVELTIQDLVDTCRFLEMQPGNMDDSHLVNAAGKEPLGGGVLVGITVTLQNALIAFEARLGPSFVICSVRGGNVVAVDASGNSLTTPIHPTAYVQVVIASSSSATLQELSAIQYSSFNNGVHIDPLGASSGTEYPWGTPQQPVNNVVDAITIAVANGFRIIRFFNDYTFGAADVLDEYVIEGEGQSRTLLDVGSAAVLTNCTITGARVIGALDGGSAWVDCREGTLSYVDGIIENCMLEAATITLGGTEAHFVDCYSGVPGANTPIINCNGGGVSLGVRDYNGGVKITNKTGPESVSIDLNSGQVILDSTVTNGTIIVRGVGKITNNATGSAVVDSTNLIQSSFTPAQIWAHIVEAGFTAEQLMRLLAAVATGNASGLEGAAPKFRDLADSKDRVAATYADGDRTVTTRDGS